MEKTEGYPYFLLEWGEWTWDAAERTSVAPLRSGLIAKGMVWSLNHGDTAFTVPLFDEFMKRIMPAETFP